MQLTLQKLEGWGSWGYRAVKFHYPNFKRISMIPPSDGQTDRQTDGRTDRRTGDSIYAL